MKIKELHIQNYKSLVDLKIIEPNPFSVFVGPNGAGKSNIFEALEFLIALSDKSSIVKVFGLFGGLESVYPFKAKTNNLPVRFIINLDYPHKIVIGITNTNNKFQLSDSSFDMVGISDLPSNSYKQFFNKYSRIFIGNSKILRQNISDDTCLNADCSNLEKVLKRILKDKNKREDIVDWLDLLIPGFENIDIVSEPLSGTDSLVIYEKGTNKPFTKNLLSDGTYNILSLLTAVYQSDEPQFLCIEEPENGLNPKVQKELVNLFRQKCEDEGHYIWINTHSQTIVNQLEAKELIIVDKIDGATQIKQLTDFDTSGLPMDEAWLTNTLGGGLPW